MCTRGTVEMILYSYSLVAFVMYKSCINKKFLTSDFWLLTSEMTHYKDISQRLYNVDIIQSINKRLACARIHADIHLHHCNTCTHTHARARARTYAIVFSNTRTSEPNPVLKMGVWSLYVLIYVQIRTHLRTRRVNLEINSEAYPSCYSEELMGTRMYTHSSASGQFH